MAVSNLKLYLKRQIMNVPLKILSNGTFLYFFGQCTHCSFLSHPLALAEFLRNVTLLLLKNLSQ